MVGFSWIYEVGFVLGICGYLLGILSMDNGFEYLRILL
jgi:hypothetical protein